MVSLEYANDEQVSFRVTGAHAARILRDILGHPSCGYEQCMVLFVTIDNRGLTSENRYDKSQEGRDDSLDLFRCEDEDCNQIRPAGRLPTFGGK